MRFLYLLPFILLACNADPGSNPPQAATDTTALLEQHHSDSGYYFYFDQLDHYRSSISESELNQLSRQTAIDSFKLEVLDGYRLPRKLSDTAFIAKLESLGFAYKSVAPEKFAAINEIFREKDSKEHSANACINIYRDVLVFRHQSKIVGLAKVCFGCHAHLIRGTAKSTDDFGQDGDYARLHDLLR